MAAPDSSSRQVLDALEEDRARLRARVGMPNWLAPTVAFFCADWVASPAVDDRAAGGAYAVSLVGILVAIHLATRAAGVRHDGLGGRAVGAVAVATLLGLALYSTSLGLVSLDLRWWVVLPALAAAGLGHGAVRSVERSGLARVTRGR